MAAAERKGRGTWAEELEGEEVPGLSRCLMTTPLLLMGTVPHSSFAAGDIWKCLMLSSKS